MRVIGTDVYKLVLVISPDLVICYKLDRSVSGRSWPSAVYSFHIWAPAMSVHLIQDFYLLSWQSVQKRKDDMARAVDETRRKLESVSPMTLSCSCILFVVSLGFVFLEFWKQWRALPVDGIVFHGWVWTAVVHVLFLVFKQSKYNQVAYNISIIAMI